MEAGFSILEASDGREAIEVFRNHANEIGAVVLDVNMPGIGGEETFAALRALRTDVPVVITSGYDEHEATRRFATPGLAAFLKKPYTADELTASVSKAIRRGRECGDVARDCIDLARDRIDVARHRVGKPSPSWWRGFAIALARLVIALASLRDRVSGLRHRGGRASPSRWRAS
jgi:DNA-binding response OmpR family regulator